MLRLSSIREVPEFKGTIRVRKRILSLGPVIDVDGKVWDIGMIYQGGVSACPRSSLHPYYTDTSNSRVGWSQFGGDNVVRQTWDAYAVEVVQ